MKSKRIKERTLDDALNEIEQDTFVKEKVDFYQPLADLILEVQLRREELGMTQADLAKKMGTRQSVISRFENMGRIPSYTFLIKLSKALEQNFFMTINGDYAVVVPEELRPFVDKKAKEENKTTKEVLTEIITGQIDSWRKKPALNTNIFAGKKDRLTTSNEEVIECQEEALAV